jgi:hypothetical protein
VVPSIARRRRTARCALGAVWLWSVAARAASWQAVTEATERLERGDYAGALELVEGVPDGDPAAADAKLVRQAIEGALAPRFSAHASLKRDNLPFDASSLSVGYSAWPASRLKLSATVETLSLLGSARLTSSLAKAAARLRLGGATFDVHAELGGRYWSDDSRFVVGGLELELFPTERARYRVGLRRDEELGNFESARWHILRDAAYASVELQDFHAVDLVARAEALRYSDDNVGWLGYIWCAYAIPLGPVRLRLGYGGAYRDSRESRWDALVGYFPYMTPLQSLRHGPLGSVTLQLSPVEVGVGGGGALIASERDPTTVGYFESRRDTSYYEGRAYLRIGSDAASILAAYELLQDGDYYDLHAFRLGAELRL